MVDKIEQKLLKEIEDYKKELHEIIHDTEYCRDHKFHGKRLFCPWCEKLRTMQEKLKQHRETREKLLFELVEYKELMGSPCFQSQLDKRKEIEEWMNKLGRHQNENFNKAIIAHFIDKHKEVKADD